MSEKQGVYLQCNACGYGWNYKGKKQYNVSCPDCHKTVRIRELPKPEKVLKRDALQQELSPAFRAWLDK